MSHITEQKQELRAAILERLQGMNELSRAAESRTIVRRILEVLPHDKAVCAYVPLKTEPDIRPLLEEILKRGQPLYLPVCAPPATPVGNRLLMLRITNLVDLIPGSCGIPEPDPSSPALDPKIPVIVLVPGRAFDVTGGRLGRGNGGYDRWITEHRAENSRSQYFGVAFDCQMVSAVPIEPHDAPVDGVFTSRRFEPVQK